MPLAKGFRATGTINPSRFVTLNVALDSGVKQCVSGDDVLGISHEAVRDAPRDDVVPTAAAASGDDITVYGLGEVAIVELAETVTAGAYLKPDNDGKAVAATLASDFIGARALEAGVSGNLVRAQVQFIR